MTIPTRMSEAEVSLRLAIFLIVSELAASDVEVALDGAQIRLGDVQYFDVGQFLGKEGWRPEQDLPRWQCRYLLQSREFGLVVHSQSGKGDVTATLRSGQRLVVEAKKGTLTASSSSSEYPLVREALGQLLTLESVPQNALLAIAVPHGVRFIKLAERWRTAPLVVQSGIRILTVAPTGEVFGLVT